MLPTQSFDGWHLKLPHWDGFRKLSPTQAIVVRIMWGEEGEEPPIKTWKQIQLMTGGGYKSFLDLFRIRDMFRKVGTKQYQLRRDLLHKIVEQKGKI